MTNTTYEHKFNITKLELIQLNDIYFNECETEAQEDEVLDHLIAKEEQLLDLGKEIFKKYDLDFSVIDDLRNSVKYRTKAIEKLMNLELGK